MTGPMFVTTNPALPGDTKVLAGRAAGTTALYVGLITAGTPTQTASGITGIFGILND